MQVSNLRLLRLASILLFMLHETQKFTQGNVPSVTHPSVTNILIALLCNFFSVYGAAIVEINPVGYDTRHIQIKDTTNNKNKI